MKTVEDYMNDPEIIDEPMPLREIHAIRLKIYDETKDMTLEQYSEMVRKIGEDAAKEYGFHRIANTT